MPTRDDIRRAFEELASRQQLETPLIPLAQYIADQPPVMFGAALQVPVGFQLDPTPVRANNWTVFLPRRVLSVELPMHLGGLYTLTLYAQARVFINNNPAGSPVVQSAPPDMGRTLARIQWGFGSVQNEITCDWKVGCQLCLAGNVFYVDIIPAVPGSNGGLVGQPAYTVSASITPGGTPGGTLVTRSVTFSDPNGAVLFGTVQAGATSLFETVPRFAVEWMQYYTNVSQVLIRAIHFFGSDGALNVGLFAFDAVTSRNAPQQGTWLPVPYGAQLVQWVNTSAGNQTWCTVVFKLGL